MGGKKTDRRVIKTKTALENALAELLMERDLRDISVIELTSRSAINRGTFYLHYKSIEDLYTQIESSILDEFSRIIALTHEIPNGENIHAILLSAYKFIAENSKICMAVLKQGGSDFLERMFNLFNWRNINYLSSPRNNNDEKLDQFCFSYITSGCVGLMRLWFSEGMVQSPEDMAKLTTKMVDGSVRGIR